MEWEGVDGLRSCMMSGSGSFSFNSTTYANKLSWNRHACRGKRNPASEPLSHLTWQTWPVHRFVVLWAYIVNHHVSMADRTDSKVDNYENVSSQTNCHV
jgi:hypothetical protein